MRQSLSLGNGVGVRVDALGFADLLLSVMLNDGSTLCYYGLGFLPIPKHLIYYSKSPYCSDVYMGYALIDMYSKCGSVFEARAIFNRMTDINILSWNSLITCYEKNGPAGEALGLFTRMMDFGVMPDEVILASVVNACVTLSAIKEGLQIQIHVIKFDKFMDDLVLSNALVDMYAKYGRIKEVRFYAFFGCSFEHQFATAISLLRRGS
ncbi:hypothetical protein GIB67_017912 [Kingdonia uniflora]|uniref:Pentatricopeptide repeat-containing protein n=1 Tax=Kingdonia uniflora TaxID=39325 RepID=A0A7J7NEK8_9MAGN|nr:hypothetical protein GIB67_017912 [Kingdonia uniflora]